LLYWKFVYYKYHKRDFTPISVGFVSIALVSIGIYAYYFEGSITFKEIAALWFICVIFLIGACIFEGILLYKEGEKINKNIDITFTWLRKKMPFIPVWLYLLLSFPAFIFMLMATKRIFGEEYIILWIMVFIAWTFSTFRLNNYFFSRNKKISNPKSL